VPRAAYAVSKSPAKAVDIAPAFPRTTARWHARVTLAFGARQEVLDMQLAATRLCLLVTLVATLGEACGPTSPPGGTCTLAGKTYKPGDSFPSPDGCNTCSCTIAGQVICTLKACVDASVPACRRSGCSGQICADHDVATDCAFRPEYKCYAVATCERQADGQCAFTRTPELAACLASVQ
jgi:hypothetical protein